MHHKAWFTILCFFLIPFYLTGCGGKQVDTADTSSNSQVTLNQTWSLAVFPFDVVGESKFSGEEVMNLVSIDLVGLEGFRIVDREALEEALDRLGFELSSMADPSDRIKVGKLLGAQLICFGNINKKLNLATTRVDLTQTGEMLIAVSASNRKESNVVEEIARKLRGELQSPRVVALLNESSKKPADEVSPPVTVEVKGYGAIIYGDLIMAKELASKDAYAKAIEQVCGVKLTRETQVENFQLVRDKILKETVGYVTSYEVLSENPDGEFGYEITVRASVSQQPISDLDKLQLVVKYLHAEPRIVVLMEGEIKGEDMKEGRANLIAGRIASQLQKAGFWLVDAETTEEERKKFADTLSEEDAARLGNTLNADLTVRGSLSIDITNRVEEVDGRKLNFPIIFATTTGVFRVIHAETAEIVFALSHEDLPPGSNKGSGTTDDAAIEESLDSFVRAGADRLAWELAAKLGEPVKVNLLLRNITPEQAEKFEREIQGMPKHIVLEAKMQQYEENTAVYQVVTSVKSKELEQKLLKLVDPATFGARELITESIEFSSIIMSLKS